MKSLTPILFTHYGKNWIRGSERCLIDLLTHLDRDKFIPIVWSNSPALIEQLSALEIKTYCSNFTVLLGWESPKFSYLGYKALIEEATFIIKENNIALIHANSGAPCQWLTAAARKTDIPLVAHLHAHYSFRDRLTLGLYQTTMMAGVSHYVLDGFKRDNTPTKKLCVIPNGIDVERLTKQPAIDVRAMFNIEPKHFVIATVGSLIPRKGIDILIKSLSTLIEQRIPAHLLIIGDGPERSNLQQLTASLGLTKQVHFAGETSAVFSHLRGGVDLFVSSAQEEAFGLVFAEAGLAELAVIGADVGGVKDVIADQKTGIVIKNSQCTTLTHAISQLYFSPAKRKAMGKAGKQHVLKNFTITANVNQFQQLYRQLLLTAKSPTSWYKNHQLPRSFFNVVKQLIQRGMNHVTS